MPGSITFTPFKGEAVTYTGTHQTSATDSTPVNITGWTMLFTVRKHHGDAAVLLQKTPTVVSGAAGTYSFSVTHADTSLPEGSYPCDVWRVDSGSERPMAAGTFAIKANATYGT